MVRLRTRPAVAAALAALTLACASDSDGTAGGEPVDGAEPPGNGAAVTLGSHAGAPGDEVRVGGRGFPAGAELDLGFGPPESEYEVLRTVTADARGEVDVAAAVPPWAERGRTYLFVLAAPRNDPRAVSEPFHVTGADGTVTVEGEITDEGVECLAMRGRDGTLYTLAGGDTEGLSPGDAVTVEGTVAEMSICMQGITLDVTRVERR